jgi:hypothetical protein
MAINDLHKAKSARLSLRTALGQPVTAKRHGEDRGVTNPNRPGTRLAEAVSHVGGDLQGPFMAEPVHFHFVCKTGIRSGSNYLWRVTCPYCGKAFLALKKELGKRVFSCGCLRRALAMRRTNWVDWSGKTVNFLRVIRQAGVNNQGLVLWEAICTYEGCGKRITITSQLLHRGQESCGCKARADTRRRALNKYK